MDSKYIPVNDKSIKKKDISLIQKKFFYPFYNIQITQFFSYKIIYLMVLISPIQPSVSLYNLLLQEDTSINQFIRSFFQFLSINTFQEMNNSNTFTLILHYFYLGIALIYIISLLSQIISKKALTNIILTNFIFYFGNLVFWITLYPSIESFFRILFCLFSINPLENCPVVSLHLLIVSSISSGFSLIVSLLIAFFMNISFMTSHNALKRGDYNFEIILIAKTVVFACINHFYLQAKFALILIHLFLSLIFTINYWIKLPYYTRNLSICYATSTMFHLFFSIIVFTQDLFLKESFGEEILLIFGIYFILIPFIIANMRFFVIELIGTGNRIKKYSSSKVGLIVSNYFMQASISGNDSHRIHMIGLIHLHFKECTISNCPLQRNDFMFGIIGFIKKHEVFQEKNYLEEFIYHLLSLSTFDNSKYNYHLDNEKSGNNLITNEIKTNSNAEFKEDQGLRRQPGSIEETSNYEMNTKYERISNSGVDMNSAFNMIIILIDVMKNPCKAYFLLREIKQKKLSLQEKVAYFKCYQKIEDFLMYHKNHYDEAIRNEVQDLNSNLLLKFEKQSAKLQEAYSKTAEKSVEFWESLAALVPDLNTVSEQGIQFQILISNVQNLWSNLNKIYSSSPILISEYSEFVKNINYDYSYYFRLKQQADNIEREIKRKSHILSTLMFSEESSFILLENEKSNQWKICKSNEKIMKILGYKLFEIEGHDDRIIMPKIFGNYHSKFLLNFVNNPAEGKLVNNEAFVYGLHKRGYCKPLSLYVKLMSNLKNGIRLIGILTKRKSEKEIIITDEFGKIEGMTKRILQKFQVQSNFYNDSKIYIQHFVPELTKLEPFDKSSKILYSVFEKNNEIIVTEFAIPIDLDKQAKKNSNNNEFSYKKYLNFTFKDKKINENTLQIINKVYNDCNEEILKNISKGKQLRDLFRYPRDNIKVTLKIEDKSYGTNGILKVKYIDINFDEKSDISIFINSMEKEYLKANPFYERSLQMRKMSQREKEVISHNQINRMNSLNSKTYEEKKAKLLYESNQEIKNINIFPSEEIPINIFPPFKSSKLANFKNTADSFESKQLSFKNHQEFQFSKDERNLIDMLGKKETNERSSDFDEENKTSLHSEKSLRDKEEYNTMLQIQQNLKKKSVPLFIYLMRLYAWIIIISVFVLNLLILLKGISTTSSSGIFNNSTNLLNTITKSLTIISAMSSKIANIDKIDNIEISTIMTNLRTYNYSRIVYPESNERSSSDYLSFLLYYLNQSSLTLSNSSNQFYTINLLPQTNISVRNSNTMGFSNISIVTTKFAENLITSDIYNYLNKETQNKKYYYYFIEENSRNSILSEVYNLNDDLMQKISDSFILDKRIELICFIIALSIIGVGLFLIFPISILIKYNTQNILLLFLEISRKDYLDILTNAKIYFGKFSKIQEDMNLYEIDQNEIVQNAKESKDEHNSKMQMKKSKNKKGEVTDEIEKEINNERRLKFKSYDPKYIAFAVRVISILLMISSLIIISYFVCINLMNSYYILISESNQENYIANNNIILYSMISEILLDGSNSQFLSLPLIDKIISLIEIQEEDTNDLIMLQKENENFHSGTYNSKKHQISESNSCFLFSNTSEEITCPIIMSGVLIFGLNAANIQFLNTLKTFATQIVQNLNLCNEVLNDQLFIEIEIFLFEYLDRIYFLINKDRNDEMANFRQYYTNVIITLIIIFGIIDASLLIVWAYISSHYSYLVVKMNSLISLLPSSYIIKNQKLKYAVLKR